MAKAGTPDDSDFSMVKVIASGLKYALEIGAESASGILIE
jgi:hypothetical protein